MKESGVRFGKIVCLFVMALMLFSSMGLVNSFNTTAEPLSQTEDSTPPYPPFRIWGAVYDENNLLIMDTTVTITNLITGESIIADVYGNGAYDAELEDLQRDYSIGDEIEITATFGENTAGRTLVVEQMGFGERIDIHFGNSVMIASDKNLLSSAKLLNGPSEFNLITDYEPPLMSSVPMVSFESPNTIFIDSSASQNPTASSEDGTIPGKLTKNWLTVSDFHAGAPVVYLNQDTQLFIDIMNAGGDAGDDDYILCISQARADTSDLLASTNKQSAKVQLNKVIQELDDALVSIENNQRLDSLENVKKAITFLDNAGNMGVDTSNVISNLATGTMLKITTVFNEATSNFGSEHPDVKDAEEIFNKAMLKYESGKYTAAMSEFMDAFEAVLGAYECNIQLTVFDIIPKQFEIVIAEPVIHNLSAETTGSIEVIWHPTKMGVHYVRLNMTGEYEVFASPGESVESPPTVLSAGFPVAPMAEETILWPDGKIIDTLAVFPGIKNSETGERFNSTEIRMYLDEGPTANLIIQSGGTLVFNDNVTFVIENTIPEWYTDQYGIHIDDGGKFTINSPARTTMVMSSSETREATYPFHNHGTLDFLGASVLYTYGPKGAENIPLGHGGIVNHLGSTCSLTDCQLTDADTHTVVADNCSLSINGIDTLVGKGNKFTETNYGTGITITGINADVDVDGVMVDYNYECGIKCDNAQDIVFRNTIVQNNRLDGINISASSPTISNSNIRDNGKDGIVLKASNATIDFNCIYDNNENGIACNFYSNSLISNNSIYSNECGIRVVNSSPIIKNNPDIWQNMDAGIRLNNSSGLIINNIISSNGAEVPYNDDMENGIGGWVSDGFWHQVDAGDEVAPEWNISYSGNVSW